jgi:hypothetical protein
VEGITRGSPLAGRVALDTPSFTITLKTNWNEVYSGSR